MLSKTQNVKLTLLKSQLTPHADGYSIKGTVK
jgi:hypothetical protein